MSVQVSNLTMGPATLYTGAFGATEPATVATTPASGTWTDVGATQDGLKIKLDLEFTEFEVDQVLEIAERRMTKRDISVTTTLAEVTLANLTLALNGGTTTTSAGVSSTYSPASGLVGGTPGYSALIFDANGPGGYRRRVTVRKALQTDSPEINFDKKDQTTFGVTFSAHYVSDAIKSIIWTDALV